MEALATFIGRLRNDTCDCPPNLRCPTCGRLRTCADMLDQVQDILTAHELSSGISVLDIMARHAIQAEDRR